MKTCSNKHSQIVFDDNYINKCPLCNLTEHNNEVHDFIESKGDLYKELVVYQKKKEIKQRPIICDCGDHIELQGIRDYKFENGKYYCVDCM